MTESRKPHQTGPEHWNGNGNVTPIELSLLSGCEIEIEPTLRLDDNSLNVNQLFYVRHKQAYRQ